MVLNNKYVDYLTGGDDYNSGPYNVTFTAGMTSSSLVITINDDNMFEDNENFVLKFDSVPSIIAIGDPREATLTILDNEGIMKHQVLLL